MTGPRLGGMLAVTVVSALAMTTTARADDEIVVGAVVKVEHGEVYISLGSGQGVTDGADLRIKRTVRLRHPVTRANVVDWIPIGTATVTQAGGALSRAVVGDLVQAIKVGDVVEIYVDRPDRVAPPGTPIPRPPTRTTPVADPETVEVLGVFASQTGQSIDARIAGWERYLSTHRGSRFADAIRRDVETLRDLRDRAGTSSGDQPTQVVATVGHAARARAPAGESIPMVFVLEQPDAVASAFLHYRARGARTYRRVLLVREHDLYLRGAVPAEAVQPPGVDYFVEVSTPSGHAGLALASPLEPLAIDVTPPPLTDRFSARPGLSSVKIAVDYLDFATFDKRPGDHADHQTTANVDFIYRLDTFVQSIGVGYGVFAGTGGFGDATWSSAIPAPRSGFHYGYADVEVGGETDRVALSAGGKLIAGVGKAGFGMGAEGRFRIGSRDRTNLMFAARTLEDVGYLTDIRFGARPARDLLIGISVGATNQPNRGDVGVKLGTEFEWIGFRNVSLIVRASWQGREVDHGGLGGGGGVGVYW